MSWGSKRLDPRYLVYNKHWPLWIHTDKIFFILLLLLTSQHHIMANYFYDEDDIKTDGSFQRKESIFRNWISKGRIHLLHDFLQWSDRTERKSSVQYKSSLFWRTLNWTQFTFWPSELELNLVHFLKELERK